MNLLNHPANRCFVCGQGNPAGLGVSFRLEDNRCLGETTIGFPWVGWRGLVHGGILYSLLDDVMANWIFLQNEMAFTARCEVRYRQPLPVDIPILLEGWPLERRRSYVRMKGKISRKDNGSLVAEAEAGFMIKEPSPEEDAADASS